MRDSKENKRIEVLKRYEILDTPPDGSFDEFTALASKIFDVPIAIISLVDHDRIWFKSAFGLEAEQIPRSPGLCSSAILSEDIYIVEDARKDPRTIANPLVAGMMGLQFYAAAPLRTEDGYNLGTFCIIDQQPRTLTGKESTMLVQLSRIVMNQIETRLKTRLMVKELLSGKE